MSKKYEPAGWESLFTEGNDNQFRVREEGDLATYETPASALLRLESAGEVRGALQTLSTRSREVMVRHYGFLGEPESLSQIGRILGVSKQRVSKWEVAAKEQLRTKLKDRNAKNET